MVLFYSFSNVFDACVRWSKYTTDAEQIAFAFNLFFCQKMEDLKSNIDPKLVVDPLEKLK